MRSAFWGGGICFLHFRIRPVPRWFSSSSRQKRSERHYLPRTTSSSAAALSRCLLFATNLALLFLPSSPSTHTHTHTTPHLTTHPSPSCCITLFQKWCSRPWSTRSRTLAGCSTACRRCRWPRGRSGGAGGTRPRPWRRPTSWWSTAT